MLYAAYGSNLDPHQMAGRCPHSPLRGTGWLAGWRITFGGEGWDGALPTLVEEPEDQVFVALYDVTPADESALDQWESADTGLYRKVRVRVATLEGEQAAWVYVLNDFEGGMPSALTLGILADAAEAAGAPATTWPSCGPDPAPAAGSRPARPECATRVRPCLPTRTPNAAQAATAIKERFGIARLDAAFVLGSGWSAAADDLGEPIGSCPLAELPGFAAPTVLGHGGELRVVRTTGGRTIAVLHRAHPPLRSPRRPPSRARRTRDRGSRGAGRWC